MPAFDFKKAYKQFYHPPQAPQLVQVPSMRYVAVQGKGDPNEKGGAYSAALGVLYAISYAIKMSCKDGQEPEGYFPYVVPPLEGLWWMEDGGPGVDYTNKSGFCFVSMIRLPDFVTEETFLWAKEKAAAKKNIDTGAARFFTYAEGLCVQSMHIGPYDTEPETLEKMERFLAENGYRTDISDLRRHHEIYLSDPRKCSPEKNRTIIRHPIIKP